MRPAHGGRSEAEEGVKALLSKGSASETGDEGGTSGPVSWGSVMEVEAPVPFSGTGLQSHGLAPWEAGRGFATSQEEQSW